MMMEMTIRDTPNIADAGPTEGVAVTFPVGVTLPSKHGVLTIDGSAGEGGGQILRSSLTLSLLTGTPFVLEHIRAGRRKPGLMRQHLTCVRAAAKVCGARVEGAELGSERLRFEPGPVVAGDYAFEVGSAGSACLVLQTVVLPLALVDGPSAMTVSGGTHAKWAPPAPFLAQAWLPILARMGAPIGYELRGAGFYPAGGGRIHLTLPGNAELRPLSLAPRVGGLDVEVHAVVSNLSETIAQRELDAAAKGLGDQAATLHSATLRSRGPGNACWLVAKGAEITNVFTAIGDKGLRAETVAAAVVSAFDVWRASDTAVDAHLTDQLMLPIAMAGAGDFTCPPLSLHSQTNLAVVAAFTDLRFKVFPLDDTATRFRVVLRPAAKAS
ncbi:MAG: RNA 3'-terminal phosphate cyclase (ATP) [Myxococcota bacterium]